MSTICLNVNQTSFARNCLLKYITAPYRIGTIYHQHQNIWQVPELAKILACFAYNVDVIDYDAENVAFDKKYDLLIDIYPQHHTVYDTALKDNCVKVCFFTGAEAAWQNRAVAARLADLEARKGAIVSPKVPVLVPFDETIHSFAALLVFGNRDTLETFSNIPIPRKYIIRNAAVLFDNNPGCMQKLPHAFLYMATHPQVLKGLDLLLDVFSRNPKLILFVCGQFREEKEFCRIYEQELFHTENIIPVHNVDVRSDLFKKIASLCSYTVLPSCSEGMSGSVLTAMSAGLIPIVSKACGIDETDAFHFKECSIQGIEQTLIDFAGKDSNWIREMSLQAVKVIDAKYRPCHFIETLHAALSDILGN